MCSFLGVVHNYTKVCHFTALNLTKPYVILWLFRVGVFHANSRYLTAPNR